MRWKYNEFLLRRDRCRNNASVLNHKLLLLILWNLLLLALLLALVDVTEHALMRHGAYVGIILHLLLLKDLLTLAVVHLVIPALVHCARSPLRLLLLRLLHCCGCYDGLHAGNVNSTKRSTVSATRSLENDAFHALADRWKSL